MTVMIDLVEQHAGLERPPDGLAQLTCPKCGGETLHGFGLMGGGYGPYVVCDGDPGCSWFYKTQSNDEPQVRPPTGRQRTRARWRRTGRR